MSHRIARSAFFAALLLAACGAPASIGDGVFMSEGEAALIGVGEGGEVDAALQCDTDERLGNPDWPTIAAWLTLPEIGETFEAAGKGFAKVDGRKVPIRLSMRIDGRDFAVIDKALRHDEQMNRAVIVGTVAGDEALFEALAGAKSIEFEGDGRRLKADVSGVDDLASLAAACRAAAAAGV